MRKINYILSLFTLVLLVYSKSAHAQGGGANPYCFGSYATGQCNQPGPSNTPGNFINDFINSVNTSGANQNICNNNSGCNGNASNYIFYSASNLMDVSPGQTITINLQSGNTFGQGFAVFIDWNQNNVFDTPAELVTFTPGVPPAGTWSALTFTIPANQALGTYRLRVRCSFATAGNQIDPCQNLTFGETEDYILTVSPPGGNGSALTGTLSSNGPICAGQTLSITLTGSAPTPSVFWSGPNSYSSTVQNPVFTNASASLSGNYVVTVGISCPLILNINVQVIPFPNYTVIPVTTTVCQNGSFIANTSINGNPQNYSYQWITNSPLLNFASPNGSGTFVQTNPISTTTAIAVYSVVVTPTILSCPVTTTMSVQINNPPTPILTMPPPLCNNSAPTTVTASPAGGTWYGNQIVSPNGIVTPNSATVFGIFPVNYSIAIGICTATNQANISINQFRTAALTGVIPNLCSQDNPVNLMSITQNTTGTWVGVGVQANGAFFDPSPPPSGLPTGVYVLSYFTTSTPNPNVCPRTSTTAISVFNPPTPTINPIAPRCSNSPTVLLGATPGGGTWSGNVGVNILGTMNPANVQNTAGTNNVIYTAGQGTCVATSSATFHVSRFNTAALTSNGLNLCVNSTPVNLMSLVQSTVNGVWSGNPNGATNTFSPLGLATGTYQLNYNTTSTPFMAACSHSSALLISVLNPTTPSIVQVGPFCTADAPVQLSVTPATGSFIPTQYLTAGGLFTPSLTIPGNNTVQYIIGTSTCNAVDTKQINMEAFVPATLLAAVPDQCVTSPIINLAPLALNASGSWSGPGVLGTSFNPGLSGTGVIVIKHKTVSSPSGLCPDEQTIAVNVYSLAPPSIAPEGPFCNSHVPITLRATPLGGVFESSSDHAVSPGGVFNPAYSVIGKNVVNYSVTAGPCIAYAQTVIDVEEFITADFSQYLNPLCKNSSPVDLNSYVQREGGSWSGPGMLGSIFTPANANVGNNNIVVYRTHSQTEYLCPDSSAMRVEVYDVPDLEVVPSVKKGCVPLEINFNIPNTNAGEGTWVFGDGAEIDGLSSTHTYTAPGTYSVVFNYWTPGPRCPVQAILKDQLNVFDVPHPAFSYGPYDEVTISEPDVQLTNLTPELGNNSYLWQIANMYSLTDVSPKVSFFQTGEYRITLTATSVQGCKSEVSDIIVVKPDFRVFIPNSFTPNFDGVNDEFFPVFSPFGLDPKTYEMEIFDRWGKSVFYTKDITKGWNGTVQGKGTDPLKQEVYVYKIKFKDLEGRIYNRTGTVSLIH